MCADHKYSERDFEQDVVVSRNPTPTNARQAAIDPPLPLENGSSRPRLCKNSFERDSYSKLDWKSRFYAKSTSADVPINFRFNVDAHTSILAKRFYTLWARSGRSVMATFDQSVHDG